MMSPAAFAARLNAAAFALKLELGTAVREAAKEGAEHSKSLIGTEAAGWPALSPMTIERKAAAGFDTPAPLLREGELKESIASEAEALEGLIYSSDEVAVFQEMGTGSNPQGSPIPPRPFLMKGALHAVEALGPHVIEALERAIG